MDIRLPSPRQYHRWHRPATSAQTIREVVPALDKVFAEGGYIATTLMFSLRDMDFAKVDGFNERDIFELLNTCDELKAGILALATSGLSDFKA